MLPTHRMLPAQWSRAHSADPKFADLLLEWYDRHQRPLPWRSDRDPYRVWISEIMLQQTRVAAVLEHYARFLQRFPDVSTLAKAPESAVLAVWSGLGYYRRARFLRRAAREIVRKRGGKFPTTTEDWKTLPGVGRYTAAAIASIAFDEPVAAVDGNVERVLERLNGRPLALKETWLQAQDLISPERPGDFNQAMMELGATVCLPGIPNCEACPIAAFCSARGPLVKSPPASRQKKSNLHYALNCSVQAVFLVQRARDSSLMPGMWELPEVTAKSRNKSDAKPLRLRHSITTTDYEVHVSRLPVANNKGKWIRKSRLKQIPLTGLARKILRAADVI
jgi:A/G-specific adenine glycosylase